MATREQAKLFYERPGDKEVDFHLLFVQAQREKQEITLKMDVLDPLFQAAAYLHELVRPDRPGNETMDGAMTSLNLGQIIKHLEDTGVNDINYEFVLKVRRFFSSQQIATDGDSFHFGFFHDANRKDKASTDFSTFYVISPKKGIVAVDVDFKNAEVTQTSEVRKIYEGLDVKMENDLWEFTHRERAALLITLTEVALQASAA